MQIGILNINEDELHFGNFVEFRDSDKIAAKDYFLIYDPTLTRKLTVYFPQKKESQYLRRIFYDCLTDEKKELLGYDISQAHDSYDWKKHGPGISEAQKAEYEKLGYELEKILKNEQD